MEEGRAEGMEGGREGGGGAGREQGDGGERGNKEVREGGREHGKGGIQYIHKPSHNAALSIDTLLLQMKNSEHVYIKNDVYCLSGG